MKKLLIPWQLNLCVVAAQLMAAFSIFALTAIATTWWQMVLLALAYAVVGNSIYAAMHEAEHCVLLPSKLWNDCFGVVLGMFFPASFHLLRQSHLGHHFRNRSDDEAFDFYFEGEPPVWKWLQLYGILTGFFWLTIALSNFVLLLCPTHLVRKFLGLDRPSAAMWDSLNPQNWSLVRLECLGAIVFHALVATILSIPLASYALVFLGFGITWSAMQYVHHFGTERDVINGSRNLWLCRPIDLMWLHHNWHLTHHQQPTVPWIYLPAISRKHAATREFLLWHYLRMWRGPRRTNVHVENRYAGRIIR